MIAAEALVDHPDLSAVRADPSIGAEVIQLRRNAVLSPEEYSKLRHASQVNLGDGQTLSAMLTVMRNVATRGHGTEDKP
jgi:hypothetical protein